MMKFLRLSELTINLDRVQWIDWNYLDDSSDPTEETQVYIRVVFASGIDELYFLHGSADAKLIEEFFQTLQTTPNLTKREYFATSALQGLLANGQHRLAAPCPEGVSIGESRFAAVAVDLADSLIQELSDEHPHEQKLYESIGKILMDELGNLEP